MNKTELIRHQMVVIILTIFSTLFMCSLKVMAIESTLIFPIPQQIQITKDIFILDETMSIIVPRNMSKNDIFLARFLVRELSDKYGIAIKIEPRTDIPKDRKVVVMGKFDNPLIKKYCYENKLDVTEKTPGTEGYILQVSSSKIIIAGSDDADLFSDCSPFANLLMQEK